MLATQPVADLDAPRNPGRQLDRALAGQCPQVLIDALAIPQSQSRSNLSPRRRKIVGFQEFLNKSQYFQLLGAEIGHEKYQTDVWYQV